MSIYLSLLCLSSIPKTTLPRWYRFSFSLSNANLFYFRVKPEDFIVCIILSIGSCAKYQVQNSGDTFHHSLQISFTVAHRVEWRGWCAFLKTRLLLWRMKNDLRSADKWPLIKVKQTTSVNSLLLTEITAKLSRMTEAHVLVVDKKRSFRIIEH